MISVSVALANARLEAVVTFLAQGSGAAHADIYGTLRPANGADPGGAPLVSIPLLEPAGTVASAVLTITAPESAMISVTGTAVWARFVNGDGAPAWDCDVSEEGGPGDVWLDSVQVFAGGRATITAGTLG
ncbi:MAG: hypothetical protein FIB00_01470 [Chloroflexi bacterium]|nr:hypothetical protein [Chloroflexota bacterium]